MRLCPSSGIEVGRLALPGAVQRALGRCDADRKDLAETQSPQIPRQRCHRRRRRQRSSRGLGRDCRGSATPQPETRLPSALPPNAHVAAAETGTPQAPASSENGPPGSDFMVDVIKTLDIKYLPANPASSYRGIHESLINYGKNTMPEFLTCMHEESERRDVPRLFQGDRQAADDLGPRRRRSAARHHVGL